MHKSNVLYMFHLLPVSGWQDPCWWQLHGTHAESGPLPGTFRVNPGAHCSQNWPAKPRGQEQVSTHGAGWLAGLDEMTAEVRVTPASCDVSGDKREEKMKRAFVIQLMLTEVSSILIIVASEVSLSFWDICFSLEWEAYALSVHVCLCICILFSRRLLTFAKVLSLPPRLITGSTLCLQFTLYTHIFVRQSAWGHSLT